MIRKFWNDRRGNYIMMTAVAVVPIMGAMALAIDYTEMSRQRQATLNALDAAAIATARRLVEGATDDQAKAYAKEFFEANLSSVEPATTKLTVVLPATNNACIRFEATDWTCALNFLGEPQCDLPNPLTGRYTVSLQPLP